MSIIIAILLMIVLYLITILSEKLRKVKEQERKVKGKLRKLEVDYMKFNEIQENKIITLKKRNKELQDFKDIVENIMKGKRAVEDKINEIDKLI